MSVGSLPCADVFVAKLNASGSDLIYSTYIGGTGLDDGSGIQVDSTGNAYITGSTESADFPVTPGAFQTSYAGNERCFRYESEPRWNGDHIFDLSRLQWLADRSWHRPRCVGRSLHRREYRGWLSDHARNIQRRTQLGFRTSLCNQVECEWNGARLLSLLYLE